MSRYTLSAEARRGLQSIIDYVEREFGSMVADEVLAHFEVAFDRLVRRPMLGRSRTDLSKDRSLRFWCVGPSLIAYRRSPNGIEIAAIARAEQDWSRRPL